MKKQRGITLIGLVVTIIILLILAGVTVITLTGDNGLLTKAGEAKNTSENAKLEEEIQLAFIENPIDKYTNSEANIENKIKSIFEKIYGTGNVTVEKSGKNFKVKVKDTKTVYRIKYDGKVEKYEEMDATYIYAKLDDDGTLHLRATQIEGYNQYQSSLSILSNWNTIGDASYSSVTEVIIEEPIAPTSTSNMFFRCSNLYSIKNIEFLHTENVTSMHQMFYGCNNLRELDVSKFDTSNVNSMSAMFESCNNITDLDVSGFTTNKVKNMSNMFTLCSKITELEISGFNTNNVTSMFQMFYGCNSVKELNVSNFNTNNVTNMCGMFYGCNNLRELDVSKFDTSNVNNMSQMFQSCKNIITLDLSTFNTNKAANMGNMFTLCSKITELRISNFDTNNVINMYQMFYGCNSLKELDISNKFKIKDDTNIDSMFSVFGNIKIKTKQDTATKLKNKFTRFTDDNFEIVN